MVQAVLVGCGSMSKVWLEAARQTEGVTIAGLVDLDRVASRSASKGIRARRYCDRRRSRIAILEETKPDVVFDVVVPAARHDVAFAAFDHGCHLLTEKPLADSREHAQAIVAAARRANRHHAVVQNRRYLAEVRRIRRFLDSGAIGAPTSIHADFFVAPHFGGFREEMDHILLLDMAIHTFDAARYMVNGEPESVYCHEWEPKNSWWRQGSSAMAMFDMGRGIVFTYRGSWCADGFRSSWESGWRIVGETGFARLGRLWRASRRDGPRRVRDGLFDKVEPVAVPPLDPNDRVGGHLGVMQDFIAAIEERRRARDDGDRQHQEPGDGPWRDRERRDWSPCADHDLMEQRVSNRLQDIRIGTMVKGNISDPAGYIRQILPLGFESIQPFFWQTIGGKDIPRLADEIRDAIGNHDVVVSSLGMFGNPLEDRDLDRETLAGWKTLIDNAHRFGTDTIAGFTGRVRGKPLPESLPRFKEVWGELARRAADKGVKIAFENCAMDGNWASGDWNIAHNPDAWELMFDALPNDNLGLEWEPCHQLVYLIDPVPQIRKWAARFFTSTARTRRCAGT